MAHGIFSNFGTGIASSARPSRKPLPKADSYRLGEDAVLLNVQKLNVLANDANALGDVPYGLGNSESAARLPAGSGSILSTRGAKIAIAADGKISYDVASVTFGARVDALRDGETLTDTFFYSLRASDGTISTAKVTITLHGTNDRPVITVRSGGDNHAVEAGGIGNADAGDSTASGKLDIADKDHGESKFKLPSANDLNGDYGKFTFDVNGNWTFTLNNNRIATQALREGEVEYDTLKVKSADGSVTHTIKVKIIGNNDAPAVSGAVVAQAIEDALPVTINPLANTVDPDSVGLTVDNIPGPLPAGVTYNVAAQTFTLDPANAAYQSLAKGEQTTVTVNYTVADGEFMIPASVAWVITGTNDLPDVQVISGDTAAAALAESGSGLTAGGTLTVTDIDTADVIASVVKSVAVTGSAGGLDASALLAMLSLAPASGLAANPGDASNLAWNFSSGSEAFAFLGAGEELKLAYTIEVSDGQGGTDTEVVTITITGMANNVAPVVAVEIPDQSSPEDTLFEFTIPDGTFADADGNALTLTTSTLPAWLSFDAATGKFSGTPPKDFNGSLDVTVTATDGEFSVSDTFTLAISPVNDAPVSGGNAAASGSEDDEAISGSVPEASDVDGEAPTYAIVGDQPAGLTFNSNGSFALAPSAADQGLDSGESRAVTFQYVANDGAADSAPATVTITIQGVNDAPVLGGDAAASGSEDDAAITGSVPEATDVDGEVVTYAVVGDQPAGLTFNSNGSFSFTPSAADQELNSGASRIVTFQYVANDGDANSAPAMVTITINGSNDAPVEATPIVGQSSGEDTVWSFTVPEGTFTDIDSAVLTLAATLADGTPLPAWLMFTDGAFSGTPPENFNGALALKVIASDGALEASSSFMLTIDPVNDKPVFSAAIPASVAVDEDQALSVMIPPLADIVTDVDGDVVSLSAVIKNGDTVIQSFAAVTPGELVSFTPPANFNGTLIATITADDGKGGIVTKDVSIIVNPLNDAPVAGDETAMTDEDTSVTIDVLGNDTDVDGNMLTISGQPAAENGAVTVNGDGKLVYTPNANFHGTDTISYAITDGALTDTAEVSVTVKSVNDAPVVPEVPVFVAAVEGVPGPVSLDLLQGTSDVDHGDVPALAEGSVAWRISGSEDPPANGLPPGLMLEGSTISLNPQGDAFNGLRSGETVTYEITYLVTDSMAEVPAAATVEITGTNDLPVLTVDPTSVGLTEDEGVVAGSLSASGTLQIADPDSGDTHTVVASFDDIRWSREGETLSAEQVAAVSAGFTANLSGWNYAAPNATFDFLRQDETLELSYYITVTDNSGAGNDSASETVTITIFGTNDVAVVSGAVVELAETDAPLMAEGTLTSDDVDHPDNAFTPATIESEIGTFKMNEAGAWTFMASAAFDALRIGETLTETFDVTSVDGTPSSVKITITGTNDAPMLTVDPNSATRTEDTDSDAFGKLSVIGTLSITDPDAGDTHTISSSLASAERLGGNLPGGLLDLLSAGFTADASGWKFGVANHAFNFLKEGDTITLTYAVTVTDNSESANNANTQNVTITIIGSNDAPTAVADTATAGENVPITIDALANDFDVDEGDAIVLAGVSNVLVASSNLALNGMNATDAVALSADGSAVDFTPGALFDALGRDEKATVTFEYAIADNLGAPATGSVTLTVKGQNDAPVADDSVVAVAVEGAEELVTVNLLQNTLDADTNDLLFVQLGSVAWSILDESGNEPVPEPGLPPGMILSGGGNGLVIDPNDLAFNHLAKGEFAVYLITYTVSDDLEDVPASAIVEILGTNDTPIINSNSFTYHDTAGDDVFEPMSGNPVVEDPDLTDTHIYAIVDGSPEMTLGSYNQSKAGLFGTLYLNSETGDYIYHPDDAKMEALKDHAFETFTLTVTDPHMGVGAAILTIDVYGTNDAPIGGADFFEVAMGGSLEVDADKNPNPNHLLVNDTDAEGDLLGIVVPQSNTIITEFGGTVTFTGGEDDGSFIYTPDPGFFGSDTFTYVLDDADLDSQPVTVTINVIGQDPNMVA